MSADNYIFVRKRADGRYGISMRFASAYYDDEQEPSEDVPREWIGTAPEDRYGIFDDSREAVLAAHRAEAKEPIVEYGVCLGEGVLA